MNLVVRLLSSVGLLIGLWLLTVIAPEHGLPYAILVVAGLMGYEYLRINKIPENLQVFFLVVLLVSLNLVTDEIPILGILSVQWILFLVYSLFYLRLNSSQIVEQAQQSIIFSCFFFLMPAIMIHSVHIAQSISFVICAIFIVFGVDVFSYLAGLVLGGRFFDAKPFPGVSPNKTYEGLLGGVVWILLSSLFLLFYTESYLFFGLNLLFYFTAVSGDLLESAFKRHHVVKDSSSLIPGHGGFMDRFDSLMLSTPVIYLMSMFLSPRIFEPIIDLLPKGYI